MPNNLVRTNDLASAVERLNQARNVLDSLPSSVNGSLWFELVDNLPVLKFRCNDALFYLSIRPATIKTPNLTFTPNPLVITPNSSAHVNIAFKGNGTLSVSFPHSSLLTCTLDDKTISVHANDASTEFAVNRFPIFASLNACEEYEAATEMLIVQIGDSADMWYFDSAQPLGAYYWSATRDDLLAGNVAVAISCNSHYKDDFNLVAATDANGNNIAHLIWLDDRIIRASSELTEAPTPFALTFKEKIDYDLAPSTCSLIIKEASS